MAGAGIANILHRDTLSVIVGKKLFDRAQQCFTEGRVVGIEPGSGELRGTVKPNEAGRQNYTTRIWMRDEGLAYECTCPVGQKRMFCKHAVAVSIAHLEHEKKSVVRDMELLQQALMTVKQESLVAGLLVLAKQDTELATQLKRVCLEALQQG
jgi:uncharacterized Zn finger protein